MGFVRGARIERSLAATTAMVAMAAAVLTGCDAGDGSAHAVHGTSVGGGTPASPTTSADPSEGASTTGPRQMLDRALAALRAEDSGGFRQLILNGTIATIMVTGEFRRGQHLSQATVETEPGPFAGKRTRDVLVGIGADHYVAVGDRCYVRVNPDADPDLLAQLAAWLSTPDAVLGTVRPARFDAYGGFLVGRVPTSEAVLLLGAEYFGTSAGSVPLAGLRGTVPVQLRFQDDGTLRELSLEGQAVAPALRAVTDLPQHLVHFLAHLTVRLQPQATAAPPARPPAAQLHPDASGCPEASGGSTA